MSPIKTIDQLTSLRFFAAAAIVFHHSQSVFDATRSLKSPVPLDFAVSFFFVLSGFILAYNYRELRTGRQILEFYVARVSRIWPVHLLGIILVMLLIARPFWTAAGAANHVASVTVLNVLLLHAWVPLSGYFFSYNGVSWSISTELFFYLLFPFLVRDWQMTWRWKTLIVFAIALGLVVLAQAMELPTMSGEFPLMLSSTGLVYISPLVRIVEFLAGIATAEVFLRARRANASRKITWTIFELAALSAAYICGVLCMMMLRASASHEPWQIYVGSSGGALAFAILIFILARGHGLVAKALAYRPLVLLGQASFALYMTHQVFIAFVHLNRATYFAGVPDGMMLAGYWIFSVSFSIAVFLWFEQPCRNGLRTQFRALGLGRPSGLTTGQK